MRLENKSGISSTVGAAIVIVIIVVAAGAYYLLLGLPGSTSQSTTKQKYTIGVVYDVGGKGDRSFNDMAYAGVVNANKTLGVDYIEESSTSPNDYVPNMETLASKHVSMIVAVGFLMDTAVAQEAQKYPNILFAQVDGDDYNITNVVAIKFQENVGSALVGALAVAMTKTGTVGFIGGMSIGIIYKFWNGYKFGVDWAAQRLGKSVTLLPAQYTGNTPAAFNAPDVAQSEGQAMIAQHADIIFAAAGASGTGLFDAVGAADQSAGWNWSATQAPPYFAIGVDADQDYYGTYQFFVQHNTNGPFSAPSFVLTSEVKRVDTGVFNVIKSLVNNNYTNFWNNPQTWAPSFWNGQSQVCGNDGSSPCHVRGVYLLGWAQKAVGPTPYTYTSAYLTPQAKTIVTQLGNAILNGTVTVPEIYTASNP